MNREEILEKSRRENRDEGLIEAENQGRVWGYVGFSAVFIFIIIWNWFRGGDNYAPMAMFWAFAAGESWSKYRFTKQRTFLVTTVASVITTVVSLGSFVLFAFR